MWQEALLGVAFFLVSGAVVVAILRIFILKSSREAPVFRLNPQRVHSRLIHEDAPGYERTEWLNLIAEQLRRVYLDSLSDTQLRGLTESLLGWDKVAIDEFHLGESAIDVVKISIKDEDGVLAIGAKLRFAGAGFHMRALAKVPIPLAWVAKCILPVEVVVSEPHVEVHVRLTWEMMSNTSNITFCFAEQPVASANTDVQLGRSPKTIDTPHITKALSDNLHKLAESLVYPNTLAWAVAHKASGPSMPRRDDSISIPSCSPALSAVSLDTPRTLFRRRGRAAME
eukprot:TRINITY_DN25512_c0_g1_i1.p1 TRINITY_DN25512_c0_g1~~TRINITY_DN25512_c0_g1_i1.p1  ORF type:complete len:284 (+),score=62.61 TRINITY_DN25512_c0_g1_i1:157-1008(+)